MGRNDMALLAEQGHAARALEEETQRRMEEARQAAEQAEAARREQESRR